MINAYELRVPLGNILVAADFSEGSLGAIARAARLPIARSSTITIVHVLPEDVEPRWKAAIEEGGHRELARLKEATERLTQDAGRPLIEVKTSLRGGKPFAAILEEARATRAELIVIGRHGRRTFRSLLLGSTAERVIRKSELPVLVVAKMPAGPYGKPLVALDREESAGQALVMMLRVADTASAVDVVHAWESDAIQWIPGEVNPLLSPEYRRAAIQSASEELRRQTGEIQGIDWHVLVADGDPRHAILDTAALRDSDLIAVGTHGRSGVRHALLGSVAEGVIRSASCDVLAVRGVF
jgi:nucleotide-binding universal stress UspA family protein